MGMFHYTSQSGRQPLISGEVALASLSLTPSGCRQALPARPGAGEVRQLRTGGQRRPPALLLQPVRLAMGAPVPVTVDGRFTAAGFDLHLSGATSVARLQAFNKVLRIARCT